MCKHCELNCPFCDEPISRKRGGDGEYELTIITRNSISVKDAYQLEQDISKYAEVISREYDGEKLLSYPIEGETTGIYLFYTLRDVKTTVGLSSMLEVDNRALRYLLVRSSPRRR